MKIINYLLIASISSLSFANLFGQVDSCTSSALSGIQFIDSLKNVKRIKSKHYHVYQNRYFLTDIDGDCHLEIIEIINEIENETPGFLPIELSQAFDFHNVYYYDVNKNSYAIASNSKFKSYNLKRRLFYEVWLNQFEKPENLKGDFKKMIDLNKDLFLKELSRLISLLDK